MTGNSEQTTQLHAIFFAALMVLSVFAGSMAFTGIAAAANSASVNAAPPDTGSSSTHTVDATVESADDGDSLNNIVVNYSVGSNPADVSNVGQGDVTVENSTTDFTSDISSVSASNNGETLTIGFSGNFNLVQGDTITAELNDVQNPGTASTNNVEVAINTQSTNNPATPSVQYQDSTVVATSVSTNASFDTSTGDAVNVSVEHNSTANSAAIALYDDVGNEIVEYNDGDSNANGVVSISSPANDETVFTLDVGTISSNNDIQLGEGTIYASATDAGAETAAVSESTSEAQTTVSLGGLDVTAVSGPRVAANDTTVSYDVTVENTGSEELMQDVDFIVSNANGTIDLTDTSTYNVQSTQEVTLGGGATTTLTFTNNTADLPGANSNINEYDVAALTQGSPIGFSSTNLITGSGSEGSVTISVVDDASNRQEGVEVELWLESDFDDEALVLETKTTNNNGEVTFSGLAVGSDSNNPIRYTARAGADSPDLDSTTTTLALFEPTQTSDSSTVVTDRVAQPERIEVEPDSDSAIADGSDTITYTATVFGGIDGVPGSSDDEPFADAEVEVTSVGESLFINGDSTSVDGDTRTFTTDSNGQFTFTVASDEVQTAEFTFDATAGTSDALDETVTGTFVLNGEGSLAGTVNNEATTNPIADASVYVVSETDYSTNERFTSVNLSSLSVSDDDGTLFIRLMDEETQQPINNDEYDLRTAEDDTSIRKVDELNESNGAVGQGYALIDDDSDSVVNFTHTRIADEDYYAQVSIDAENSSAGSDVVDNGPENFLNVTGANSAGEVTSVGTSNAVIFQPSADLTLAAAEELSGLTGANYVDSPGFENSYGYDTGGTTEDGRFVLNELPSDFQSGQQYVAIATKVGFTTDFADVSVEEDGSFTFSETQNSNEFFLEPVEVDPDGVDIEQVGTREDTSSPLVDFSDTSDDFSQEVPRDGSTVDVFNVSTSAEGTPVNATVTVSFADTSVEGSFVNIAGGTFVSVDDSANTATLFTGSDGQAQVWYQADASAVTVETQKTAVLDADSSVTDTSNVTFVGVIVSESAEVSGIVTDSNNQPVPSVVYTEELTVGGTDFTLEPTETDLSEFRLSRLNSTGAVVESAIISRSQAQSYDFNQDINGDLVFPGVSVDSSVTDGLTLVTTSTSGVAESSSYTLPRVPAVPEDESSDNNVVITAVSQASIDTASSLADLEDGTSVTTDTEVDRTATANVEISGAAAPEFAVTSVTASPNPATQGETVTVEATVENIGAVTAEADVTFSVGETVADATEQETKTTDPIVGGSSTTVEFTLDTTGLAPGDYVHVIETGDDTTTADQTIEAASSGAFAPYVNDSGVVTDSGFNDAVSDYLAGDLSDSEINTIITGYLSGDPVGGSA